MSNSVFISKVSFDLTNHLLGVGGLGLKIKELIVDH